MNDSGAEDADPEDVLWAFSPLSDAWTAVGYDREQAQNWRDEFDDPSQADRMLAAVGGDEQLLAVWLRVIQAQRRAMGRSEATTLCESIEAVIKSVESGADPHAELAWAESPLFPPDADVIWSRMTIRQCVALWNASGFRSGEDIRFWYAREDGQHRRMTPDQAARCRDAVPTGLPVEMRAMWRDVYASAVTYGDSHDEAVVVARRAVGSAP